MSLSSLAASMSTTTSINTKNPNSATSKNGNTHDNFSQLLSKMLNETNKYNKTSGV